MTANRLPAAPRKRPTKKHRPAIWENMLGTVWAMNDDRVIRYFDYDYDAAVKYAGVTDERDPRWYRNRERVRWSKNAGLNMVNEPRVGQAVLWVK